jgi:xylulokinase
MLIYFFFLMEMVVKSQMMGKYLLVHDLGTTGNKAAIFNDNGYVVASKYKRYETYYLNPTWVEQDPEEWWNAICASTREVLAEAKIQPEDVDAITVIGQQVGLVPVDKEANLVRKRTMIWCDLRSLKQAQELISKIGGFEEFYRVHGLGHVPEMLSISKAMWLKENELNIYNRTYKFLQAKDFIITRLTDAKVFVTDYGDASNTGFLDIRRKEYSMDLLELAKIDLDKLPELRKSHEIVGYLGEKAAEKLNLKKNIPIILGTGDVPASCVGSGTLKERMSFGYIGSANWGGIYSSKPSLDPKVRVVNICHPIEDYIIFSYTPAGGVALDWAKGLFYKLEEELLEKLDMNIYDMINMKVHNVPSGSMGLIFLPYLRGGGGPHWNSTARGAYIGLTMPSTKEHMVRAVMEGVAFNFRWLLEQIESLGFSPFKWGELRAIGGGILNIEWAHIYADILDLKITIPDMPQEATAKGGFIIAALGLGWYKSFEEAVKETIRIEKTIEPNAKSREIYAKLYETYKLSYEKLVKVFDRIAEIQEKTS